MKMRAFDRTREANFIFGILKFTGETKSRNRLKNKNGYNFLT